MGQRCDTVLHALMPSSKQSSRKERTDPEAMTSTKQRWVRRDKKKRRRMAVHGRTTKRLVAHLQGKAQDLHALRTPLRRIDKSLSP